VSQAKRLTTKLCLGSLAAVLTAPAAMAAVPAAAPVDASTTRLELAQAAPAVPVAPNGVQNITPNLPLPAAPLPPTQPRAVAPPVGDISISTLDASIPQVDLGSQVRIPRLVLKDAPAREVLELLATRAGLNIAFVNPPNVTPGGAAPAAGAANQEPTVSLNLQDELVQNAFNYVLQITGYEANRVGRTIFVGPKLPDNVRETIVRTLRMNQVSAEAASAFLTTQGAETQVAREQVTIDTVGRDAAARSVEIRTPTIVNLRPQAGGASLILRGLAVSIDSRLNTLTLVGAPRKVEIATAMLTRLDARRRQVALNVKIVDVNLTNNQDIKNSVSFGLGNGFVGVDNGAAFFNYGGYNPPSRGALTTSPIVAPIVSLPASLTPTNFFFDRLNGAPFSNSAPGTIDSDPTFSGYTRPGFGTADNPFQPGVTKITQNATTGVTEYTYAMPSVFQYPSRFLATLQAQIVSGNGKILTDPTMVIQEGQSSSVNLTQEVFAGFRLEQNTVAGTLVQTRVPIIKQAGLLLDIAVDRIDDNGFVTVGVKPTISAPYSSANTPDGVITLLQSRTISSGQVRLRDGQTLILSGIIQENDRTTVTKVPILGDIPILGSLFRATNTENQRQEVVVLLTPQILDDNRSQVNYNPGNDSRLMLQGR
jgi:type IV pilus assembly protein PilQ